MKNTNPIFTLKNFRSFGEEGASFELAPITVLTGCNSAGKSSLVKALLLLSKQSKEKETWSSDRAIQHNNPSLYLRVNDKRLMLGQFDKILHNKSTNKTIELSYHIWSDYLQETVVVRRLFVPRRKDILNEGVLQEFIIEKLDGTVIHKETPTWGDGGVNFYDEKSDFCSIEDSYNNFTCAVDFLCAKRQYTVAQSINKRNPSDQTKKKLDRTVQWLEKAENNIRQYNIQTNCYKEDTLNNWSKQFYNDLDKTKFDTIIEDTFTEEEIEERKKNSFISLLVNEVVRPFFTHDIEYINSSSASIDRLYSVDDENKMSQSLRIWNERSIYYDDLWTYDPYTSYHKPGTFLNKWIKLFGLGESIEINGTSEGLGLLLYLVKDGEKRLLADEGYGITQLASLLLQIDNNIEMLVHPNEYNTSQITYSYPMTVICVEEPENHLHPKYQSMLAEMFVEAYQKYNIHFIIETHSEYLIRKLQVMVADKENTLTPNDVSLNYVEKDGNGVSSNRKIEILEDGRLSEPFGVGFYDEADSLAMELIKYKTRRK